MGKTLAYDEVTLKYSLIIGIAFEGSEEPIVELITTTMPIQTRKAFHL